MTDCGRPEEKDYTGCDTARSPVGYGEAWEAAGSSQ